MTSAPKSYLIELGGQRQCYQIWKECFDRRNRAGQREVVSDVLGCLLFEGRVTQEGYWQIQRPAAYLTRASNRASAHQNRHRAYYVHRLGYSALYGLDIQQSGSHLCGRANCINPFHLVDESQRLNDARINCLGAIYCPRHNHLIHTLCSHSPPCIKEPLLAENCCLSNLELSTPPISSLPSSQPLDPPAGSSRIATCLHDFLGLNPRTIPLEEVLTTSDPYEGPEEVSEEASEGVSAEDEGAEGDLTVRISSSPPGFRMRDLGAADPESSSGGDFHPPPDEC